MNRGTRNNETVEEEAGTCRGAKHHDYSNVSAESQDFMLAAEAPERF